MKLALLYSVGRFLLPGGENFGGGGGGTVVKEIFLLPKSKVTGRNS